MIKKVSDTGLTKVLDNPKKMNQNPNQMMSKLKSVMDPKMLAQMGGEGNLMNMMKEMSSNPDMKDMMKGMGGMGGMPGMEALQKMGKKKNIKVKK